jgi:putative DNA primase/helicase
MDEHAISASAARLRLNLPEIPAVADADWQEPQPLPDLPAVHDFEPALLPDVLRLWAMDIADRVQCPPDYVAATLMTALAAVIGRALTVRPQAQTDWTVTPNLWGALVGRPGVLKSPAMEAALAPLKRLAALSVEAHEAAMANYRGEALASKIRAEEGEKAARLALKKNPGADVAGLLSAPELAEPTLRRWMANDTSSASLGELLRQNQNGLLVYRDEIVSLLRSLDREDQAEARGFYLTAWNGDSGYTFDRIGRGLNLHIPAVCLSMIGSTQPARLADYVRAAVRGGAGDDGLIQRFGLLVWPDTSGTWRNVDRWPDGEARKTAHAVFSRLAELRPDALGAAQDRTPDGKPDGPPFLRLSPGALSQFTDWREDLEKRLRSGDLHPALESHLAKYRKHVPALALICHVTDGNAGSIGEAAMLRALAWSEYLESHACRVYGSATAPGLDAARAILRRIQRGDLPAEFSSRDVWRPGWSGLSDAETVRPGLALLADLGWLRETQRETGGRTATVYTVHPEARR